VHQKNQGRFLDPPATFVLSQSFSLRLFQEKLDPPMGQSVLLMTKPGIVVVVFMPAPVYTARPYKRHYRKAHADFYV